MKRSTIKKQHYERKAEKEWADWEATVKKRKRRKKVRPPMRRKP